MVGRTTFHFGKAHGSSIFSEGGVTAGRLKGSWEPPRTQAFWVQHPGFGRSRWSISREKVLIVFLGHEKDQTLQNQNRPKPQSESIFKFEWILSTQGLLG